ncbi:MAG: DUF84 family protein [Tuberibacillus sp.]
MLKVGVGSKNPAKLKAISRLCEPMGWEVLAVDAPSGVSAMPMSDQETKLGAVHRSQAVLNLSDANIGIGLEGGVMDIEGDMYLCNWGALTTREGKTMTASGARIVLPKALQAGILAGKELGDIIDVYTAKRDVRKGEGTIGILTNDRITRDEMFYHIAALLFGQYEYYQNHVGQNIGSSGNDGRNFIP